MPSANKMASLSVGDPGWVNTETVLAGPRLTVGSAVSIRKENLSFSSTAELSFLQLSILASKIRTTQV